MPTLGTVASSFRFEGEHLNIRQNISTIKTTDRIEFKGVGEHANETQWTLGLDGNRHFTLQNELQDVVSISANIDTGDVFVRGAGGGGSSTLTSLTDVDTLNVQNGQMMYYDSATNTYKFTDKVEILDAVKVLADICMNGYDIKNARDISANRRVEAPSMIAERYESPNEVQLISYKDNTGANILEVSSNNIRGYNIGTGQYLPVEIPDLSSSKIVCPNYEATSELHLISHKDVTGASILEVSFNSLKGYTIETDQYTPVEIPKLKTDEIEPALTLDIVGNLEISGDFTNRVISNIYESRNEIVLNSHNNVTHDYLEISYNYIRGMHDIVGGHTYVETNIPKLKCTDLSVGELSILTDNVPEIQTPFQFHIRAGVSTNYIEFDGAQLRASDTNTITRPLRVEGDLNVNGNVTGTNLQPKIIFHGVFVNKTQQSSTSPLVAGVRCCAGFSNRFPPVGTGWDPATGIFTAPRDCYMNFNWQALMFDTATGGTDLMEGVILHQGTFGTNYVKAQWAPSYADSQNQLQASPCVSAVLFMAAGDTVRPAGTSSANWVWYSNSSDTRVSFSAHNCD